MSANPQIIMLHWFFPLSETDTNDLLALKHNEVQIPSPVGGERFGGISALWVCVGMKSTYWGRKVQSLLPLSNSLTVQFYI